MNTAAATTITVVAQKYNGQCYETYEALRAKNISHTVDRDSASADHGLARELGHEQSPTVLVRDADGALLDHWSGFRQDRIDALATTLAQAPA